MLKQTLLFLWQLPQSILSEILIKIWKPDYIFTIKEADCYLISIKGLSSFSLGSIIFFNDFPPIDGITLSHERGHSKQSLILGPLYLILIGIPSIILNLLSRKFNYIKESYYTLYPEKWADKLGNVKRRY
jgi:hypothetical protein